MSDDDSWYHVPRLITTVLAFFAFWIYAAMTYGWFLGGGLGWIPAICLAILVGYIWPLVAVALVGVLFLLLKSANIKQEDVEFGLSMLLVVAGLYALIFGPLLLLDRYRARQKKRDSL